MPHAQRINKGDHGTSKYLFHALKERLKNHHNKPMGLGKEL
jgi:hypothetical protein